MKAADIKIKACYSDGRNAIRLVLSCGRQTRNKSAPSDPSRVRFLIVADGAAEEDHVGEIHDIDLEEFAAWAQFEVPLRVPPLLPSIAYLDLEGNGLDGETPYLPRICGPFRSPREAERRHQVLQKAACKDITLFAEPISPKRFPCPITWEYIEKRRLLDIFELC